MKGMAVTLGSDGLQSCCRCAGSAQTLWSIDDDDHRRLMKGVTLTHVGGPTVLIEVAGWRLLTDPTFDPPGQRYKFGLGISSRKLGGPAVPAERLAPIDAVLLSHDHHEDNLDPAGRALLPSAGAVITTA